MQLDCYQIYDTAPEIRPGIGQRGWMDKFENRHPYRCLPLTMANSTGWEILCPFDIEIVWDGGVNENAILLQSQEHPAGVEGFVGSHFRRGIVTFHTGYLFRTPPGWGVWATGSPNHIKHGVAPLTGLIETDWLPFPFTMNWQMTKPGRVRFERGEPFCFITLMEHPKLEDIEPQIHKLDEHPELKAEYDAWRDSRDDFNKRLQSREADAVKAGWQRHYMRGQTVTGESAEDHRTKRRLKPPVEGGCPFSETSKDD